MKTRISLLFLLVALTGSVWAKGKDAKCTVREKASVVKTNIAKAPAQRADEASDVVYSTSFEDDEWTITDKSTTAAFKMKIGSMTDLPAVSGDYYLVSGYDSDNARDAWAISPKVSLKGGVTYYISAYVFMPGYGEALDSLVFTIGTDNTIEAQTTVLLSLHESIEGWALQQVPYTPAEDGLFAFGIHHATADVDVNGVGVDDFIVSTSEQKPAEPRFDYFTVDGADTYFWENGELTAAVYEPADTLVYVNFTTTFCDSVAYEVVSGTIDSLFMDEEGDIYAVDSLGYFYPSAFWAFGTGDFEVKVKMFSSIYPENDYDTIISFKVVQIDDAAHVWSNINPGAGIYASGSFSLQGGDFNAFAEAYYAPANAKIDSISLLVAKYYVQEENLDKKIRIKFMASDAKYNPDPHSQYAYYDVTYRQLFGDQTIEYPTEVGIKLDSAVVVEGDFHVALDLDRPDGILDTEDARDWLYLMYSPIGTYTGSLYLTPECAEYLGAPLVWYNAYQVLGSSISFAIFPNIQFTDEPVNETQDPEPAETAIKFVNADSKLAIYPNPAKDVLYISNLASDASAVVTDLTGKQLMSLSHVQNSVSVAGLAQGVYFISIKDAEGVHTAKFVKE